MNLPGVLVKKEPSRETEKVPVLVVDDEAPIRSLLLEYLGKHGYDVYAADTAESALRLFAEKKPSVVVTDIRIPDRDGISLLRALKQADARVQVIIITAYPSQQNAMDALREEAFDYLIKPFGLADLKQKIDDALELRRLSHDNIVLKEMASLHQVTSQIALSQNLEDLLSLTMNQTLSISYADSGSILLADPEGTYLAMVRSHGIKDTHKISPLADESEWKISKWVYRNRQPLLIQNGAVQTATDLNLELRRNDICSAISLPLIARDTAIGVLNLNRTRRNFAESELNILHVLASQVGVAIGNTRVYGSLKRQLRDLTLISSYSELLMERIEKTDIIDCFFMTIQKNFPMDVDFAAMLLTDKTAADLVYWSRFRVPDAYLTGVRDQLAAELHTMNPATASITGTVPLHRHVLANYQTSADQLADCKYHFIAPLITQENTFGAVCIASQSHHLMTAETRDLITALISQTCIALVNSNLYNEMKLNYFKTIKALAIAVDAKDTYTGGHSENVSRYATMIAARMGLSEKDVANIRDAGLVHDVGKIGIPGHILNKPGLLTSDEFNNVMKNHCALGANIVKEVPFLAELYPLILHHHEHFDGHGYPEGLASEKIPLGARILAVADGFHAMTSDRPYRKSLGREKACTVLAEGKGKQWDPRVVDLFLELVKKNAPPARADGE